MHLLNVYSPYKGRRQFWDRIDDMGLLSLDNLVLVGDLKLIPLIWKLEEYFVELFNKYQRVDIAFSKITSTWRSKKVGVGYVNGLTVFYLREALVDFSTNYIFWVLHTNI